MVHAVCIEKRADFHTTDEPLKCEDCGTTYSVSIRHNFVLSWSKFCSCRALGHCFEFCMVLVVILCWAGTLFAFNYNSEKGLMGDFEKEEPATRIFMYVLVGMTLIMLPLTLKTIFTRWFKANAVSEVVDVV
mmetsp:Transcript_20473/g.40531  ORF Transcript_20473/g.40531 Transcript_20473/m.40531 type:complete len:132 (-) Transcript_20473:45-440(-)